MAIFLISNVKNYVRYRKWKFSYVLQLGVPINMGIQWRIRYSFFKIILWLSIVMPTEKDVILRVSSAMSHVVCSCFDCYVTCCLFMFWLQTVVFSKTWPSSLFILQRHYRHIFTVYCPFHKINSSRHYNIMAFEIR